MTPKPNFSSPTKELGESKRMNYQYVWLCDNPICGFECHDKHIASKHVLQTQHTLTKCKNPNDKTVTKY